MVAQTLDALAAGPVPILPQDKAKVTKAPKLRKEDGQIDWSRPAQSIHNLVRAMQPWPVASTTWHHGTGESRVSTRIIVHKTAVVDGQGNPGEIIEAEGDRLVVAAAEGAVRILILQVPGKKPFSAAEFLRGYRGLTGDLMGPPSPADPD